MKKKSVAGQIFGVFLTHVLVSLMMFFILMGIVSMTDNSAFKAVISAISAIAYAFIIFSKAYECAADDLKSYSTLKPYAAKGFLLISVTAALIIALAVLNSILWKVAPLTENNVSYMTVLVNALYLFMTSPFLDIIRIKGADCNIWGQLISIAVPLAASAAGYYAGFKKWDYVKCFNKFVYESKRK